MKAFHLTFATDNFGAISQVLVDMGISFHVELVDSSPSELTSPARAGHAAGEKGERRKKTAKKAGASAKPGHGQRPASEAIGAAPAALRLREAISRGRSGLGPLAPQSREPATPPPEGERRLVSESPADRD